jgi:CelD/BcsL family acetyltransferase involved in cellulose biosynthesis
LLTPDNQHPFPPDSDEALSVLRSSEGLSRIKALWERLECRAANPTQHYIWAQACVSALACEGELHVTVLESTRGDGAIAALNTRPGLLRPLELLGGRQLREPSDLVYSDESLLESLARSLAESGHPLVLDRIPAASPVAEYLKRAYRGRGIVITRAAAGCPWRPLDPGWLEPEQCLSSNWRSSLHRAARRARKLGAVRSVFLAPTPTELESQLDTAIQVEAAGWKGRQGTALACDSPRAAFYRQYAAAASRKGILRICFLYIGDRPAAMQIAVEWASRFWLLKIGYDESYKRCSPGALLMLEVIREAARRGLRSVEFLGAVEPWTRIWTQLARPCVSVRAYPASVTGQVALARDATRFVGRKGVPRFLRDWRRE